MRKTRKPPEDKALVFIAYWRTLARGMSFPRCKEHPQGEYQFAQAAIGRNWQFDAAWPEAQVAVEIDGGNRMAKWSVKAKRCVVVGRHTQDADLEKLNTARDLGWVVYQFTPQMLKGDPARCVARVAKKISERLSDGTHVR
ncbi:MAG: hypothetical protein JXA21_10440 [Anaerolineae bacterium]|nr:hypothetical protein [Anaerolineae bacterium]